MGRDKGLLKIAGQPLIVRTARLVEPLVSSVGIVGPPEPYDTLGLRAIADHNFGASGKNSRLQGPLAGIATALAATDTMWNLILACDLPYLTHEWVDWLLARAANSQQQIVMPRTARGPEPLAAVYHRDCAEPIAASLARGVRKVAEAIEQFQVDFVFEREWRHIDPGGRVLRNMNTPADYDEAVALLEKP
jgi:molybdopterin-guanine dinucleotide biosynthesis protein A